MDRIIGGASALWWKRPLMVASAFVIAVGGYCWVAFGIEHVLAGILLALCSGVIGTFFGFLFGIPRALSSGGNGLQETSMARLARQRYATNTNLEQISDWLTKAILAIALVELKAIVSLAQKAADFLVPFVSKEGGQNAKAFVLVAGCLLLITGFLGGYLWTRVFLTKEFRNSEDEVLETPEYYEGLMHAYLYRTPGGYLRTLEIAKEYQEAHHGGLTGQMYLYLACAQAQRFANLSNEVGEEAKRKASEARAETLRYAELAMKLESENKGLIRLLWRPGPQDDHNGDFVIFKDDPEFQQLMEKYGAS
jgi:hypothetical protein